MISLEYYDAIHIPNLSISRRGYETQLKVREDESECFLKV